MGNRDNGPAPDWSDNICIILVRPQNEGNIGAAARCMMNFGITDLRIVGDYQKITEVGEKRAKHAQSILEAKSHYNTLEESLEDLSISVGTSGKRELGEKTAYRHFLLPNELPKRFSIDHGRIGIVFGPEGKGLLNEELRLCDLLVTIPTWEGYPIMNLSHAVSVICYEWYTQMESSVQLTGDRRLDPKLKARFRQEVARLVSNIPLQEHKKRSIEDTMNRIVLRGLPKDEEISRILALITASADSFSD